MSLAVFEHGTASGKEILFVHGFCQCRLAWNAQLSDPALAGFRLVAFDLRGHGDSEKPDAKSAYDAGQIWADDLAAVMDAARLNRPVLVAWSYGARVVLDYLRHRGSSRIAGINFVSAALRSAGDAAVSRGPNLSAGLASEDDAVRTNATRVFLRSCFQHQPSDAELEATLVYNMLVSAPTRRYILERAPVDAKIEDIVDVPALISQGAHDRILSPEIPERAAARLRRATFSLYEESGHAPMIEFPQRFNEELAEFVAKVSSSPRNGGR